MADEIVKIDDHIAEAGLRFLEQYKGKVKHTAVIDTITQQYQDMEDTLILFIAARAIPSAVGTQLDLIGTIVDRTRPPGESDQRYRVLLWVKIGQNTSQGEAKKIVSVYRLLSGAIKVHYHNLGDGSVGLASDANIDPNDDPEDVRFVYENMQDVVAGGVRIDYLICFSPDNDSLALAGNPDAPGLGLGDALDASVGGKLSRVHRLIVPLALDGGSNDDLGLGNILDPLTGGTLVSA